MKRFFFRIINLGIHQTMSFAERKKSRIANGLAAMIVILGLVLSILSLFFPILPLSILLNLSAILGGGITLLFNFWQKHQIARLILILFFIIFLSTFSLFLGEDFGLEYNLFSVMIGIAVFFDRKMYFIPLFILCAIAFIVVKFGFQYVTPIIPPEEARNNYYVNLVFNFILCFWGLYIFKVEHLEYKEVIEGKNKELHKKNEDITASITYAKRIQTAMLPRMEDIKKALPEFFILFKPRDIVSGDFYFFKEIVAPPLPPPQRGGESTPSPLGRGQGGGAKIIIACADCTGHGVPGAFMSMIGNETLTNIVEIQGITSPDLILNELHKNIRSALKQGETENRDGMDISIITLTRNSNLSGLTTVEYAGAMNPLYYIQNGEFHEIKADKFPIGGSQKEQERIFTKHEIQLGAEKEQSQTSNNLKQPQTVIYLCSDGFQDQFGGSQGRKFMVKKFRELLLSIHHLPMDEQRQILDDTIENWMAEGKARQIDDILVMGIRI